MLSGKARGQAVELDGGRLRSSAEVVNETLPLSRPGMKPPNDSMIRCGHG